MTADLRAELDRMAREIADLKARVKMLEPGRHQPHVSYGSGDMRAALIVSPSPIDRNVVVMAGGGQ